MKELTINPKFKDLIPPLTPEEFSQLEENCLKNGIIDSIQTWQNVIIDGHNRYEIAQKHNLNFFKKEMQFESEQDATRHIILNQFGRRNISKYQRSVLALQLEDIYKEKAAANLKTSTGGSNPQPLLNSAKAEKIDTRQELAKLANVGHDTMAKVKKIQAKAPEELKLRLQNSDVSINEAYKEVRRAEKQDEQSERFEQLMSKPVDIINQKYDVIVIDPPWEMEKIKRDVAPMQVGFDYPTMTIDEIKEFELPAEKNCHVFMWITHKHLPKGFEIFEAWKVKYVLAFVWHKNGGFQPFGLPQYNCEFILYGRIGTPEFFDVKDFNACFNAKRQGHSVKPDEFYQTINRVTAGNKIDIFNRRNIEGFDTYGNESD